MPVHILGNMCDMGRFLSIVKKYPLPIVEDATEALGSSYKGQSAGTFSPMACFSFNGNKIISTGGRTIVERDVTSVFNFLEITAINVVFANFINI